MLSQACVSASSRYRGAKLPRIDFVMSEPKYQRPGASAERYLPHEDALGTLAAFSAKCLSHNLWTLHLVEIPRDPILDGHACPRFCRGARIEARAVCTRRW